MLDLTSGPRFRLSDPLVLDDGHGELSASFSSSGGSLIEQVEAALHSRFHGVEGRLYFRLAEPSEHIISGEDLVEALLGPANRIDSALRRLTPSMTGKPWAPADEEALLLVIDGIRDGQVDAAAFAALAASGYARGDVNHRLLFARNAHILVEQFRTSMLRAFDRADTMLGQVRLLLDNPDNRYFLPLGPGEEITHASRTAERVHAAFTESVAAIATSLDLLYRVFVYVLGEPFGSPELPGRLHFPYHEAGRAYSPFPKGASVSPSDLGPAELPYALPNLPPDSFFALRGMRNDLTHNFTSGHIQPICWIGRGTPLVSAIPIRYVQIVAPDVDKQGKPVKHPFVERFYSQQRDCGSLLKGLLEELALTADHTLRWLAHRLEGRLATVS